LAPGAQVSTEISLSEDSFELCPKVEKEIKNVIDNKEAFI